MTIALDDHRHGTRQGYKAGCRRGSCPNPERRDCTHAHSVYLKRWRLGQVTPLAPVVGVQRRIRALCALGWPYRELGPRLGVTPSCVGQYADGRRTVVTGATVASIRRLYDELSMTPGPSRKGRLFAEGRGWLPPLAWDDETIDDPAAEPYRPRLRRDKPEDPLTTAAAERQLVDDAVVERVLAGDRVKANALERAEAKRRWVARGGTIERLNETQGWNVDRDRRRRTNNERRAA